MERKYTKTFPIKEIDQHVDCKWIRTWSHTVSGARLSHDMQGFEGELMHPGTALPDLWPAAGGLAPLSCSHSWTTTGTWVAQVATTNIYTSGRLSCDDPGLVRPNLLYRPHNAAIFAGEGAEGEGETKTKTKTERTECL